MSSEGKGGLVHAPNPSVIGPLRPDAKGRQAVSCSKAVSPSPHVRLHNRLMDPLMQLQELTGLSRDVLQVRCTGSCVVTQGSADR